MAYHPAEHAAHDGDEDAEEALQVAQAVALQEEKGEGVNASDEASFPQGDSAGGVAYPVHWPHPLTEVTHVL